MIQASGACSREKLQRKKLKEYSRIITTMDKSRKQLALSLKTIL
jgi:hypothetical protein